MQFEKKTYFEILKFLKFIFYLHSNQNLRNVENSECTTLDLSSQLMCGNIANVQQLYKLIKFSRYFD